MDLFTLNEAFILLTKISLLASSNNNKKGLYFPGQKGCFSNVIYIKTLKVQSSDYSKFQFLIQNLFSFMYFLFIAIESKTIINLIVHCVLL